MGKPMTLHLLNAGFTVNVWNRSPEKLIPVVNAGAKACTSIRISQGVEYYYIVSSRYRLLNQSYKMIFWIMAQQTNY